MTKEQQKIFKEFLAEIEINQKGNYNYSTSEYKKLSDFSQLVKDEIKEITNQHNSHKAWNSFCFTKSQSDAITKICDVLKIPYVINVIYSDIEPNAIDYVEIKSKI